MSVRSDFPNPGQSFIGDIDVTGRVHRNVIGKTQWPTIVLCDPRCDSARLCMDAVNASVLILRIPASKMKRIHLLGFAGMPDICGIEITVRTKGNAPRSTHFGELARGYCCDAR